MKAKPADDPADSVAAPSGVSPTPAQRRILWRALTALALLVLAGVAGLVFLGFVTFLSWAYPILLPLGLAVIVALMLEPVVNFVQHRGLPRRSATLAVSLLAVIGFLLFWAFLLPRLANETGSFFYHLPGWIDDGLDKLQTLETAPVPATNYVRAELPAAATPTAAPTPVRGSAKAAPQNAPPTRRPVESHTDVRDWIKSNIPVMEESIERNVANLVYTAMGPVGQALGFLLGFSFVPIYVYYFLADQDHLARHWHEYVPLRRSPLRNEVVSVLTEINEVLVRYFRGQIVVAACNGVLIFIGLTIIGVPYSLVLGVMAGALSIVPFLGIITSILPALLLGFLYSHGWVKPLLVLVVFAAVQMIESMFITPRVQSHSTGLHPVGIILGILFWSLLLPGLLGPVVAVPLTCAVVVLLRRYVWQTAPS